MGVVDSVLHLPANDILVVRTDADREVLVPFVREIVPTVTLDGIEIDPPPGLIDDAAADAGGDDDANGSAQ